MRGSLLLLLNNFMKYKIGDRVKYISNTFEEGKSNPKWGGKYGKIAGTITRIDPDRTYNVKWDNGTDNTSYKDDDLELIIKATLKTMKLKEYKKIAKYREKIRVFYNNKWIEGICGGVNNGNGYELDKTAFYFWQNEIDGNGNRDPNNEFRYSNAHYWENDFEVEVLTDKIVKRRKAYVEITKEVGKIYISIKIPTEIEDFFKANSNGETKVSEVWFNKTKGVEFYKQPAELDKKLVEIDSYVYSDFGSGLMKSNKINVAILRSVGISKGIKIHSEGFSSLTNAELQDYVKRLGLYIKALWESNISATRIKSVITFEL